MGEGDHFADSIFERRESAKFRDWMKKGRRKKKERKFIDRSVVVFSRAAEYRLPTTGNHRFVLVRDQFKKSLEKNRARAAMRLLLKINEASRGGRARYPTQMVAKQLLAHYPSDIN